MCVPIEKGRRRARWMMVVGNFSLVLAFLFWNFAGHGAGPRQPLLHAFCGLLFGISIGANLSGIRLAKRCRASSV